MSSLIPGDSTSSTESTEATQTTTTESTQETTETTTDTTTENTEAKFQFADGVDGTGERPEWFNDTKYKTVSDQAKGYNELESKFGAFTGAPAEGKYEIEGMDLENSPLLKLTAEWGAENQLSNDGLASLIERVNGLAQEQIEQDAANAKEALGENADKRLNDLSLWGKNNLSPEEFEQFQGLAQTAGHVGVLEKLIAKTKNSKLVKEDAIVKNDKSATEELKEMQLAIDDKGNRLMDNPDYRKKYNAKKALISKG